MQTPQFQEPFRSQFVRLVREGAGTRDIHDAQAGPYTRSVNADDAMTQRELGRMRLHQGSLCALLEQHVGPVSSVLDVGCGTGGSTVAMALSRKLGARMLIGVDPNADALEAARMRAQGYGVSDRVSFQHVQAGRPLPFETGTFALTTCISVLEFVSNDERRAALVHELERVTRPSGYVVVFTPNALRLREYHSRRLLGNIRRDEGYPWSSTPWRLRTMFVEASPRFLSGEQLEHGFRRRHLPGKKLVRHLPLVGLLLPWQKIIATKH